MAFTDSIIKTEKIVRRWFTVSSTIGELYLNDQFYCFTMEDTARPYGVKIPKFTCIPDGTDFKIIMNLSSRFGKVMPLIYNSDDLSVTDIKGKKWTGIRQHIANTPGDLAGCIGLGHIRSLNYIGNSGPVFNAYYSLLQESLKIQKIIPLTIVNEQTDEP